MTQLKSQTPQEKLGLKSHLESIPSKWYLSRWFLGIIAAVIVVVVGFLIIFWVRPEQQKEIPVLNLHSNERLNTPKEPAESPSIEEGLPVVTQPAKITQPDPDPAGVDAGNITLQNHKGSVEIDNNTELESPSGQPTKAGNIEVDHQEGSLKIGNKTTVKNK